jgi:hypothetical protein
MVRNYTTISARSVLGRVVVHGLSLTRMLWMALLP